MPENTRSLRAGAAFVEFAGLALAAFVVSEACGVDSGAIFAPEVFAPDSSAAFEISCIFILWCAHLKRDLANQKRIIQNFKSDINIFSIQ